MNQTAQDLEVQRRIMTSLYHLSLGYDFYTVHLSSVLQKTF